MIRCAEVLIADVIWERGHGWTANEPAALVQSKIGLVTHSHEGVAQGGPNVSTMFHEPT